MISKCSLLPEGGVILICFIFPHRHNWELVRRRGIVVAQSWHNRNARKKLVQMPEDTFGDIHDVLVFWGRRVSPMGGTVASPDNEFRLWLKLVHCLQG